MEPDRPRHDNPAACVTAQEYSSATFVSFRVHSRAFKKYYKYFDFLRL
jgi:hypothetical protein